MNQFSLGSILRLFRFSRPGSTRERHLVRSLCAMCLVFPLLISADASRAEKWSYDGTEGPNEWKGFCRRGHHQSPVNITDIKHFDQSHLAAALLHLEPTHFQAEHIHNIVLLKADKGSILLYEGRTYELNQAHWHTPSEHKVRGQAFDMEMHWVFLPRTTKKNLPAGQANFNAVVIAVFMQVTEDSLGLSVFDTVLTHIPGPEHETDIKRLSIDLTKFLPPRTFTGNPFYLRNDKSPEANEFWQLGYYAYDGSLTTPPCTEKVRWLLLPRLVPITQKELDLYVEYAGDHSARPVQPLYDRKKEDPLPVKGIFPPWATQETSP